MTSEEAPVTRSSSVTAGGELVKRALDVAVAAIALVVLSPILLLMATVIWAQDYRSPFYIAARAARGGGTFRMVKFRSMTVGADRSGVDSTSANDSRITSVGRFLRRYKLDELPQLWNVLCGQMSFVGPRPQVIREVELYTPVERQLLDARPGITDLASIVFADEGDILGPYADPDIAYNQLVRPWKSRLGLLYVRHASATLDVRIVWLTLVALVSRGRALAGVAALLEHLDADAATLEVSRRRAPLQPAVPPGASTVVVRR
jgi:lipopolysaccharide/colanic/teichoic acid biosynthesis glycosyltransferase